ncbi:hypothetical protein [Streptomyces sp. NPDC059564]|uniref:hypothetical protein n=1 Tax=Streptomyces sp. NPDC059564 TaxID=3346865 RepID=UPI0036B104B0
MGIRKGRLPRIALLVAAALFASGLMGCGPAPKSLLAVERAEGGGVRLLIASCADYDVDYVSVFLDSDAADESWRLSNRSSLGAPGQIELFEPLDGWMVDQKSNLTELRTPGTYVAKVDGAITSRGLNGRVSFTLASLEKLDAGKVISGTRGDQVMGRSDFLKPSPDRCKP